MPFGGSFYNIVQWCAWVEPGSNKVRLQVSCDVTFTKRFVPVKGIIYSSSIEVSVVTKHQDVSKSVTMKVTSCEIHSQKKILPNVSFTKRAVPVKGIIYSSSIEVSLNLRLSSQLTAICKRPNTRNGLYA